MLADRIEGRWIDSFEQVFRLCEVRPGDAVAILSETQSRALNVHLAELALHRLAARPFHVVVPTPRQDPDLPVPVRSTGASRALAGVEPAIRALAGAVLVVDLTVEGMLHAPELPGIVAEGARLLFVSNEHPDVLERLAPDETLRQRVRRGIGLLRSARRMRVTSAAGSDLTVDVEGASVAGASGFAARPGTVDHWPGGLVACFPRAGTVNGTLVLDAGDVNLTFKRYLERPVRLVVEADYVTRIEGEGTDAELMRSYFQAWNDREAYATSHVGWGMSHRSRWDALTMYDRRDVNGTEQRTFAGNFLYSTGANEFAGRYTAGHFDLPMRNCTIAVDGALVVDRGVLQGDLA